MGSPSGVSEWGLRAGDLAPALTLRGWRLARASRPRHLSSAGVAVLLTPRFDKNSNSGLCRGDFACLALSQR